MKVKDLIENCVKDKEFYIKIGCFYKVLLFTSNKDIRKYTSYQILKEKEVKQWSFEENPEYGICQIDVYI